MPSRLFCSEPPLANSCLTACAYCRAGGTAPADRVGSPLSQVRRTSRKSPRHCEPVRAWQSASLRPHRGRAMLRIAGITDCQKVNCPKGKRGHPGVRRFAARNDRGNRNRSFLRKVRRLFSVVPGNGTGLFPTISPCRGRPPCRPPFHFSS